MRKNLKYFIIIFLFAIVFFVALFVNFMDKIVHKILTDQINSKILSLHQASFKIQDIKFISFSKIRIRKIEFFDIEGKICYIDDVLIKLSIDKKWKNIVTVKYFIINKIEILKKPLLKKKDYISDIKVANNTSESNITKSWFSKLPKRIVVEQFDINHLIIKSPVLSNNPSANSYFSQNRDIDISIKSKIFANLDNMAISTNNRLESKFLYFLDSGISTSFDISYNLKSTLLKVSKIKLSSDHIFIRGNYEQNLQKDVIKSIINFSINNLRISNGYLHFASEAKISGSTSRAICELSGKLSAIDAGGVWKMPATSLKMNLEHIKKLDNKLNISFNLVQDIGILSGKIFFDQNYSSFKIDNLSYMPSVANNHNEFEYRANLVFQKNILTGKIGCKSKNMKEIGAFLPSIYRGNMIMDIDFLTASNHNTQGMKLNGHLTSFSSKFLTISSLFARIESENIFALNFADSIIDAKNLVFIQQDQKNIEAQERKSISSARKDIVTINQFKLMANCKDNAFHIDQYIYSNSLSNLELETNSVLIFKDFADYEFIIESLTGSINKHKLSSKKAIKLSNRNGKIDLLLPELNVRDGKISIEVDITPKISQEVIKEGVSANSYIDYDINKACLKIDSLPLSVANQILPDSYDHSILSGLIEFKDTSKDTKIFGKLNIDKVSLGTNIVGDMDIILDTADPKHALVTTIISNRKNIAEIKAQTDLTLSLYPFSIKYQHPDTLISLKIKEPIDVLSLIPIDDSHKIKGEMIGEFGLSKLGDHFKINGHAKLINGSYEYRALGIKLSKASGIFKGVNNDFKISDFTIFDRFGNVLKASGNVMSEGSWKFSIFLQTDKLSPISMPFLKSFFKGQISVTGDENYATASGKLQIENSEITIPDQAFIVSVPVLNISRTNAVGFVSIPLYQFLLDIEAQAGKNVYIKGWGIDATLQGNLKIKGDINKPSVVGSLKLAKGKYREFGKLLDIKNGELNFVGLIPPSPFLNIAGVYKNLDAEIRIILYGPIMSPSIKIESIPQMTQEDALSRLLFGKDSHVISVFQGLQLANSIQRLSNNNKGIDLLGASRKFLKVDEINIKTQTDQNNNNNTAISVGKYIGNNMYIELEQGVSTKTKLEIELSPRVSIESIVENTGKNSVGLNWRFDY